VIPPPAVVRFPRRRDTCRMASTSAEIQAIKAAVSQQMRLSNDMLKQANGQVAAIWKAIDLLARRIDEQDGERPAS